MALVVTRVDKFTKAKLMRALFAGILGTIEFTQMGHIAFNYFNRAVIGRATDA